MLEAEETRLQAENAELLASSQQRLRVTLGQVEKLEALGGELDARDLTSLPPRTLWPIFDQAAGAINY